MTYIHREYHIGLDAHGDPVTARIELRRLSAIDLGKTLTVEYEMATVTGELRLISHREGHKGPATTISIHRDGWSWVKSLPSSTAATITTFTPAAPVAGPTKGEVDE